MLSKKEIKDIQSLGLKKQREETGLFIAEGPKLVTELAQVLPGELQMIYGVKEWMEESGALFNKEKCTEISEVELERMSHLQTAHKVLAVFRQLPSVEPLPGGFTLYLDTIQDPGNFGTIIRIADWFGIRNVVCSAGCADLYNPKVVQATMASIARVNVYYDEEGTWLDKQGTVPVFAAALEGKSVYSCNNVSKGILLIGNESKGIRKEYMAKATEKITIPRVGAAESLNAAVATGIILSHLVKN
ncbi:MAG TPA: RNA methyltransferase [Flavisolibacter sp.]|nr:RNA methyltransferase [Flavisolibacter sp.]